MKDIETLHNFLCGTDFCRIAIIFIYLFFFCFDPTDLEYDSKGDKIQLSINLVKGLLIRAQLFKASLA